MAISISGSKNRGITAVSNYFIDHFMPYANGAYVKVYLYLLRCLSCPERALSLSSMADFLSETEGDILRAVCWLENEGLLMTDRTAEDGLCGIHILDAEGREAGGDAEAGAARADYEAAGPASADYEPAEQARTEYTAPSAIPQTAGPAAGIASMSGMAPVGNMEAAAGMAPMGSMASAPGMEAEPAPDLRRTAELKAQMPTYSNAQIQMLSENEEVKWIMNVAERYLERLLNPADNQLIVYLYESVGFPADLILYLYEHCASKGKKNPTYIEAVALNWAAEGIRTVEEAELISVRYNANYNAVMRVFGLGRMPGAAEQKFIDRWAGQFGFDVPIIEEACSRSLLSTQKPDFKYADKILENWHKKGVRTKKDIEKEDHNHSQNAAKTASHNTKRTATSNRFNAFPQRSYTGEDYSSMEQRLLNRQG